VRTVALQNKVVRSIVAIGKTPLIIGLKILFVKKTTVNLNCETLTEPLVHLLLLFPPVRHLMFITRYLLVLQVLVKIKGFCRDHSGLDYISL